MPETINPLLAANELAAIALLTGEPVERVIEALRKWPAPPVMESVDAWMAFTHGDPPEDGRPGQPYTINVCCWDMGQVYGGPEEGGWWRDSYTLIATMPVHASRRPASYVRAAKVWALLATSWLAVYEGERPYTSAAGGMTMRMTLEAQLPDRLHEIDGPDHYQ